MLIQIVVVLLARVVCGDDGVEVQQENTAIEETTTTEHPLTTEESLKHEDSTTTKIEAESKGDHQIEDKKDEVVEEGKGHESTTSTTTETSTTVITTTTSSTPATTVQSETTEKINKTTESPQKVILTIQEHQQNIIEDPILNLLKKRKNDTECPAELSEYILDFPGKEWFRVIHAGGIKAGVEQFLKTAAEGVTTVANCAKEFLKKHFGENKIKDVNATKNMKKDEEVFKWIKQLRSTQDRVLFEEIN